MPKIQIVPRGDYGPLGIKMDTISDFFKNDIVQSLQKNKDVNDLSTMTLVAISIYDDYKIVIL